MKSVSSAVNNTADRRSFDPDPATRSIASELYHDAADLPIVSPHGHIDPRLFADPNASFGSPADLFIIPDHYVFRMLYSQGVALESLGVPRRLKVIIEEYGNSSVKTSTFFVEHPVAFG